MTQAASYQTDGYLDRAVPSGAYRFRRTAGRRRSQTSVVAGHARGRGR